MNQTLEQVLPAVQSGTFPFAGSRLRPKLPSDAVAARPVPSLMGIAFDPLTIAEAAAKIEAMIRSRQPHYVVTANVDFLVQARRDVELRRLLLDAHLVLCDGTPLLWLSRWLNNPLPERVAGADLVPQLIQLAEQKGHRIYFLGGAPEVANRAVTNLHQQYPRLNIVGHYSPPFKSLLEMDHADIARRIREAKPDLLLVSFGCPKAEKWVGMNYQSLGVPVAIGVGATIDFLAGQVKRAPRWMRRTGLEWIFRLAQEPRRLLGRYARDLWGFGLSVPIQCWQFRDRRTADTSIPRVFSLEEHPSWIYLTPPSRLNIAAVRWDAALWEKAAAGGRHCLVNMAAVESLDSSGVGLLISLHKRLRNTGRELVLIAPSRAVRQTLSSLRLDDYFTMAPNKVLACARFNEEEKGAESGARVNPLTRVMEWRGEVTAANAETIWLVTAAEMELRTARPERFVIDLSRVRFMDSTGVGLMIRVRNFAREHGIQAGFTGAQGNVRNVLRWAKLEAQLLEACA